MKYLQAYARPGRAGRLRHRPERADLLLRLPVHELERLGPRLLHQERPAARAPGRGPVHQGAGARLELGQVRRLRRADRRRRGGAQPPATSAGSPGTATAATSAKQTTVHNQYPQLDAYDTEHSGGTWIANQQREDMLNIIDYTRNWGRAVIKWSLAVDQNGGPHNGGCGTCTGWSRCTTATAARPGRLHRRVLHDGPPDQVRAARRPADRLHRQRPVPNVAWKNPDGSKALIAYNDTGGGADGEDQLGRPARSPTRCPAKTSATFTWAGTQSRRPVAARRTGPITGLGGKCVDVAGRSTPTAPRSSSTTATARPRRAGRSAPTARSAPSASASTSPARRRRTGRRSSCTTATASGASSGRYNVPTGDLVNPAANKCLDVTDNSRPNGTRLQIWTCTGAANQKWQLR